MTTVAATPLTLERVAIDDHVGNILGVLERIVALIPGAGGRLPARAILDDLLERERLGSTSLGQGAALPHPRFGGSRLVAGAFLGLPRGVDALS